MPESIGPHLLGRKPSPPDSRDWKLERLLSSDPLDVALSHVLRSWTVTPAQKRFDKAVVDAIHQIIPPAPGPTPAPIPTPSPTPNPDNPMAGFGPLAIGGNGWADDRGTLDQGDTGHCVGFTGADFKNLYPVPGHADNDEGHRLYYACKDVEGEPKQENGAYVRSLMKVLTDEHTIDAYAAADTVDALKAWIEKSGAACLGTNWYTGMFSTDAHGRVVLTGKVEGGHAYTAVGDTGDAAVCMNHWGPWGYNSSGLFLIDWSDVERLLHEDGESWVALELAA